MPATRRNQISRGAEGAGRGIEELRARQRVPFCIPAHKQDLVVGKQRRSVHPPRTVHRADAAERAAIRIVDLSAGENRRVAERRARHSACDQYSTIVQQPSRNVVTEPRSYRLSG